MPRPDASAGTSTSTARIKGAPAIAAGRLVVGSYDGHVYAFDPKTGRIIWRTEGPALGQFYSSPAISGGRVFIGSTDGNIYAFALSGGRGLWSHSTSGYVYASPVIDHGTLYAGSYDGSLYALDTDTGRARWTYAVGGRISGSAAVVDGIVYVATLEGGSYGIDTRSGVQRWRSPIGDYSPVAASTDAFYLVGASSLSRLHSIRPDHPLRSAPHRAARCAPVLPRAPLPEGWWCVSAHPS